MLIRDLKNYKREQRKLSSLAPKCNIAPIFFTHDKPWSVSDQSRVQWVLMRCRSCCSRPPLRPQAPKWGWFLWCCWDTRGRRRRRRTPPGCAQWQSCCRPVRDGSRPQWSSGTGRTRCGPPRPEAQLGLAGLVSPGDPASLVGGTADPGGPDGARGASGGKMRYCSKTAEGRGSAHQDHFGTCEGCDLCVRPHSGFGSERSQCGKEEGCPCVSGSGDARRDKKPKMSRTRRSYQTLNNKREAHARGPWRLRGTSQGGWAGRRGRCQSCCWNRPGPWRFWRWAVQDWGWKTCCRHRWDRPRLCRGGDRGRAGRAGRSGQGPVRSGGSRGPLACRCASAASSGEADTCSWGSPACAAPGASPLPPRRASSEEE